MRRHHWSAAVLALFAVFAGSQEVLAQNGDAGDGDGAEIQLAAEAQPRPLVPYNADWPAGEPGPTGNPYLPYGQYDPAQYVQPAAFNSPIATANVPPGANPWPAISPFENQFEQHTNKRGLWFKEVQNDWYDGRDFYFGAAYMYSQIRRPGDRPIASQDSRIPPFQPADPALFQPVKLGEAYHHDLKTNGMILRWGFKNTNDTGFELQGIWVTEGTQRYRRGTGQGDIINYNLLRDTNGIPLVDGSANIGSVAPYDILFLLTHSSEMFGGNADFIRSPWLKDSWYSVAPTFGASVFSIQEKFTFQGRDSALNYTITDGGSPVPGSVGANPFGNPAYESYLQSRVDSWLFGPQAGLKYTLGGEYLKFVGQTRAGVLLNVERLNLEGRNIGDGFTFNISSLNTGFQYRDYTTHLSPMIQQNISAEAPILRLVPYVRNWKYFEDSVIRVGYNYMYVAELSRPENNIIWRGTPLKPEMKPSHSTWHTSGVSFEIDFKY